MKMIHRVLKLITLLQFSISFLDTRDELRRP